MKDGINTANSMHLLQSYTYVLTINCSWLHTDVIKYP